MLVPLQFHIVYNSESIVLVTLDLVPPTLNHLNSCAPVTAESEALLLAEYLSCLRDGGHYEVMDS